MKSDVTTSGFRTAVWEGENRKGITKGSSKMPQNYTVLCIHPPQLALSNTSFTTVTVEKGMKARGRSNGSMFQWDYALAQNILVRQNWVQEMTSLSRTVRFTRDLSRVCVCVLGGVTVFRSSIIPVWHQLESEEFAAATPASASDSWDKKNHDVCSLGRQMSVRISCESGKSIRLPPSPWPVPWRSRRFLRPCERERIKLDTTGIVFHICFVKTQYPGTYLLFLPLLSPAAGGALEQSLYVREGERKKDKNDFWHHEWFAASNTSARNGFQNAESADRTLQRSH